MLSFFSSPNINAQVTMFLKLVLGCLYRTLLSLTVAKSLGLETMKEHSLGMTPWKHALNLLKFPSMKWPMTQILFEIYSNNIQGSAICFLLVIYCNFVLEVNTRRFFIIYFCHPCWIALKKNCESMLNCCI